MKHGGNLRLINEYVAAGKLGFGGRQPLCRVRTQSMGDNSFFFPPRKESLLILKTFSSSKSQWFDGKISDEIEHTQTFDKKIKQNKTKLFFKW